MRSSYWMEMMHCGITSAGRNVRIFNSNFTRGAGKIPIMPRDPSEAVSRENEEVFFLLMEKCGVFLSQRCLFVHQLGQKCPFVCQSLSSNSVVWSGSYQMVA